MIERDGERLIVRGAITLAQVTRWREAGIKAIDRDGLTIDLAGVDEADSSALSASDDSIGRSASIRP